MQITQISEDLKNYLVNHDSHSAWVHSVFNEAFNIIDEQGELITFLSQNKAIEPMSAIIETGSKEFKLVRNDDPIEITSSGFIFLKTAQLWSVEQSTIWNPNICVPKKAGQDAHIRQGLRNLKSVILTKGNSIGLSPLILGIDFSEGIEMLSLDFAESNEYCDFAQSRIVTFLRLLAEENYEYAADSIPNIIGFGPGLTPSTDDFMVGILLTLIYESVLRDEQIEQVSQFAHTVYKQCLGRTTKVSEIMIKHASVGRVSESYRKLIQSVIAGTKEKIEENALAVIQHGASSGTDFLFGVYCMSQVLLAKRQSTTV